MGAGGGGQSGTVAFPAFLENFQTNLMAGFGTPDHYPMSVPLMAIIQDAIGNSPLTGVAAYSPDTRVGKWETEIGVFETLVDALSETTGWAALMTQAVTSIGTAWTAPTPAAAAEISADVDAFEAITDDRVENTVLPRFQRGMQDINAVMSSAFVIGQAIIEGMADRDIAKYQGELRTKAYLLKDQLVADSLVKKNIAYTVGAEQMVRYVGMILGSNEALARMTFHAEGAALEAERTEAEVQLEIDETEALWDLSLFQHAANMLASTSGAVVIPGTKRGPSRTQSTIGGAMSGAAMGAQVSGGNPYATGIGAVLGAYLGYSQS